MSSLAHDIQALNESARKVHGSDITIMVARAIAFGDDDNLIIVGGKNHHSAAVDIARSVGRSAKISVKKTPDFIGSGKTAYSYVTF